MPRLPILLLTLLSFAAMPIGPSPALGQEGVQAEHDAMMRLVKQGNYRDAYDGLRRLALAPTTPGRLIADELPAAIDCLRQLNRIGEFDALVEEVAAAHPDDWRVQAAVAAAYQNVEHYGSLVAGKFERGPHRGPARAVNSAARDRVRALQLYRRAIELIERTKAQQEAAFVAEALAATLSYGSDSSQYWRLQSLTDLQVLPDYEEGWGHSAGPRGAPVDADGNPIFYDVPPNWSDAANDGQRWRWALERMVDWDPASRNQERVARAGVLLAQFGVQTLAEGPVPLRLTTDGDQHDRPPIWQLDTLAEDETIARLASGIRRFQLPDDQNYIKLYQQVLADRVPGEPNAAPLRRIALSQLGNIFENRRQYPRAADYWRMASEEFTGDERENYRARLQQIVGNWGEFEGVAAQPAGRGATVDFRFRNARRVEFTAQAIDVARLLADVKAYLKRRPQPLDWHQLNVSDIGYRLVQEKQAQYVGEEVARWQLELEPRDRHFDRRITVTTPLEKAGAYLVTAKVDGGNTSQIVLWLADLALLRKPMPESAYYFVADALTGRPIAKANVELFGYRQRHVDGNRFEIDVKNFAETTDADGQVFVPIDGDEPLQMQWLATATTADGRLAFLGFHSVWRAPRNDLQVAEAKTFVITDRPVYRPEQTVEFKIWVAQARYGQDDKSPFAHQAFQIEIRNPKGEKVFTETLTSDNFGGLAGKFALPADAVLGQYSLQVVNHGGGHFRVEEYKKPEFEVTVDAPQDPVMLGENITATIRAKYYFGSPVTQATVKYKVLRTAYDGAWFPPAPWDWLYGAGYWWFGYDYSWLPGWRDWGCRPPAPWWWIRPSPPPEIVAEREAVIGPDGTLEVEIDTSLALALHPDQDHRYEIHAEVVDASRRTIVGSGTVLVARKPFRVFAWVDRGYYRVGDTINANFAARRLDGRGVAGAGKLRLLKISYDADRNPVETEVRSWDLATNDEGQATLQFKASEPGQYRLAYAVTDQAGHTIEGGYVLTIAGEGFDGSDFRFRDLELIPLKRHYAPGEKLELQVNANRVGATVLLFLRPVNGAYPKPQILKLAGKSTIVPIEVTADDVPNFFVEAVTVFDGRVHTQTREIAVPPTKRIVNVEVVPSADAYQPGQRATIKLKLTDEAGKPVVGSTALTIYDKSVEYISGGSNVPDIRAFFWKSRRQHQPHIESNLARWSRNLVPPDQLAMQGLGIFGDTIDDGADLARSTAIEAGAGGLALGYSLDADRAPRMRSGGELMTMAVPAAPAPENDAPLVTPTVRSEFADTALWVASLDANADGLAEVALDMPQNLTTWRIRAWAMGPGTRVGEASAEVVTRKNIIVRMQAPRFFVERDEVVLSANVHNYLPTAKQVTVRLEESGECLELPGDVEQLVDIPAGGERRIDWRVKAARAGEATIRMAALTDEESDAVQMRFPVLVHGILKMDSYTGSLGPADERGSFVVEVPSERRAEQTRLEVRYSPTLAGAMVDALPYLIEYPYGCTEQTLNRFLPAVITQRTLLRLGLDLKTIQQKRTNLDAQEVGGDVQRTAQRKPFEPNPVFDEAELRKIVTAGVQRLTEMQLADGGWGWFSGFGEQSTPHSTATVVRGLQLAKANDIALVPGVLERGIEWLQRYQREQLAALANVDDAGKAVDKNLPSKTAADNMDALVYLVLVEAGIPSDAMRDYLDRDRTKLAVYGLALYGLALARQNDADKLAMVLRNLRQYVVEDDENQTAYLNLPPNQWWYWYGSEFEAHACFLKLLVATRPQDPLAPRIAKYLVNNRRHANYWNSTRDTALVIEALADYIQATGEDQPEMTVELWIDAQKRQEVKINAENLFTFDNRFVLTGDALEAGRHTVELRKRGAGPLYYSGYLTNFTLEDDIRAAGLELKVERRYYKLSPANHAIDVAGGRGQVLDQRVEEYNREELPNLAVVESGNLIEIELVIESKNDYEYIVLNDQKAAGCEPVALRSGYGGNELGAYMELRDESVSFFLARLARGRHSLSYRMRAEIPGRFSALPTQAAAMYAPELRGNSDELKLRIED